MRSNAILTHLKLLLHCLSAQFHNCILTLTITKSSHEQNNHFAGMGTGLKKKKPDVKISGDYCRRKCNIFHPESAISGPFKGLKKNRIQVKTGGCPSLILLCLTPNFG